MTLKQELKIAELRTHICGKGHSMKDAYVFIHPFDGKIRLNCKTCALARRKKVPLDKRVKHGLYVGNRKKFINRGKKDLIT